MSKRVAGKTDEKFNELVNIIAELKEKSESFNPDF